MTKVIDAENILCDLHDRKLWLMPNKLYHAQVIELEPLIDKRIAAAFLDLVEQSHIRGPISNALTEAALKLDPPAKAEVRLNPCECGGRAGYYVNSGSSDGIQSTVECDSCHKRVVAAGKTFEGAKSAARLAWNAANPIQPVAEEKRYQPGQRFLYFGQGTYRTFVRQDGTVGIISSNHVEQDDYSCRIVDGGFTMKDLFGSWAKNWQPID